MMKHKDKKEDLRAGRDNGKKQSAIVKSQAMELIGNLTQLHKLQGTLMAKLQNIIRKTKTR